MTFFQIEKGLDAMEFDSWDLKLSVANECAWCAELRICVETNHEGCDISTVFFAAGGFNPMEVGKRVYDACKDWNKKRLHS
jgi:hypothetical protein